MDQGLGGGLPGVFSEVICGLSVGSNPLPYGFSSVW